jgi:hypothetical protein
LSAKPRGDVPICGISALWATRRLQKPQFCGGCFQI